MDSINIFWHKEDYLFHDRRFFLHLYERKLTNKKLSRDGFIDCYSSSCVLCSKNDNSTNLSKKKGKLQPYRPRSRKNMLFSHFLRPWFSMKCRKKCQNSTFYKNVHNSWNWKLIFNKSDKNSEFTPEQINTSIHQVQHHVLLFLSKW